MALGTQIDDGLATSILATGTTPDTAEEWIIAAINYIHNSSLTPEDLTPYVLRDGTRSFTASETFELGLTVSGGAINGDVVSGLSINGFATLGLSGLLINLFCENAVTLGDTVGIANNTTIQVDDSSQLIDVKNLGIIQMGDTGGTGNSTVLVVRDSTGLCSIAATHINMNLASYVDDAAAGVGGLTTGDLYYNTTTPGVDMKA